MCVCESKGGDPPPPPKLMEAWTGPHKVYVVEVSDLGGVGVCMLLEASEELCCRLRC